MNIEGALDVARKFIVVRLHGSSGDIEPISASYDEETGMWKVKCIFRRTGTTNWRGAILEIDDEEEEVISFDVATA